MASGYHTGLPYGQQLADLIKDRSPTKKIKKKRLQEWAARQADVPVRGGHPAKDPYRNAEANLRRWQKPGTTRQPQDNPQNRGLILAVLGLKSDEELGQLLAEYQRVNIGADVSSDVGERVGRYDFLGPLRERAYELYDEKGFAERLLDLEPLAKKLVQSWWDETTSRAAEADRILALLDLLLNSRKNGSELP